MEGMDELSDYILTIQQAQKCAKRMNFWHSVILNIYLK